MNLIYSVASFDFDAVNYFVEVGRVTAAVKKFSFSAVCQSPMFVGRSPFFFIPFFCCYLCATSSLVVFLFIFFFYFPSIDPFRTTGSKIDSSKVDPRRRGLNLQFFTVIIICYWTMYLTDDVSISLPHKKTKKQNKNTPKREREIYKEKRVTFGGMNDEGVASRNDIVIDA